MKQLSMGGSALGVKLGSSGSVLYAHKQSKVMWEVGTLDGFQHVSDDKSV